MWSRHFLWFLLVFINPNSGMLLTGGGLFFGKLSGAAIAKLQTMGLLEGQGFDLSAAGELLGGKEGAAGPMARSPRFVKAGKKKLTGPLCETVWEEVEEPHCTMEYEEKCGEELEEKCSTELHQECSTEVREECSTEPTTTCHEENAQQCKDWQEQECWSDPVQECWAVKGEECWEASKEECIFRPDCYTVLEEQCTTVDSTECAHQPAGRHRRAVAAAPADRVEEVRKLADLMNKGVDNYLKEEVLNHGSSKVKRYASSRTGLLGILGLVGLMRSGPGAREAGEEQCFVVPEVRCYPVPAHVQQLGLEEDNCVEDYVYACDSPPTPHRKKRQIGGAGIAALAVGGKLGLLGLLGLINSKQKAEKEEEVCEEVLQTQCFEPAPRFHQSRNYDRDVRAVSSENCIQEVVTVCPGDAHYARARRSAADRDQTAVNKGQTVEEDIKTVEAYLKGGIRLRIESEPELSHQSEPVDSSNTKVDRSKRFPALLLVKKVLLTPKIAKTGILGLLGLSGLKGFGGKVGAGADDAVVPEDCHQVPRQQCDKIPVQKCNEVKKCFSVPTKQCKATPRQECREVIKQQCKAVPRQECVQVPKQVCAQTPNQICSQVPHQKCWEVPKQKCWTEPHKKCWKQPKENCRQVTSQVPREVCH